LAIRIYGSSSRGFINSRPKTIAAPTAEVQAPAQAHRDLQQALTTVNPKREVPTSLSAIFLDTPDNGAVLTASVQVANETLTYAATEGKQTAAVDVAGVVVMTTANP